MVRRGPPALMATSTNAGGHPVRFPPIPRSPPETRIRPHGLLRHPDGSAVIRRLQDVILRRKARFTDGMPRQGSQPTSGNHRRGRTPTPRKTGAQPTRPAKGGCYRANHGRRPLAAALVGPAKSPPAGKLAEVASRAGRRPRLLSAIPLSARSRLARREAATVSPHASGAPGSLPSASEVPSGRAGNDRLAALVARKTELPLELDGGHPRRVAGDEVGGPEPDAERRVRPLHHRPGHHPRLVAAPPAADGPRTGRQADWLGAFPTFRAREPVRPTRLLKPACASGVIRE